MGVGWDEVAAVVDKDWRLAQRQAMCCWPMQRTALHTNGKEGVLVVGAHSIGERVE